MTNLQSRFPYEDSKRLLLGDISQELRDIWASESLETAIEVQKVADLDSIELNSNYAYFPLDNEFTTLDFESFDGTKPQSSDPHKDRYLHLATHHAHEGYHYYLSEVQEPQYYRPEKLPSFGQCLIAIRQIYPKQQFKSIFALKTQETANIVANSRLTQEAAAIANERSWLRKINAQSDLNLNEEVADRSYGDCVSTLSKGSWSDTYQKAIATDIRLTFLRIGSIAKSRASSH